MGWILGSNEATDAKTGIAHLRHGGKIKYTLIGEKMGKELGKLGSRERGKGVRGERRQRQKRSESDGTPKTLNTM